MLVQTFTNKENKINENIVKLKLERNIKSLLHNHSVYIWAEETDF